MNTLSIAEKIGDEVRPPRPPPRPGGGNSDGITVRYNNTHRDEGEDPVDVSRQRERLHGGRERLLPGRDPSLGHAPEDYEGSCRVARTPAIGPRFVR